MFGYYNVSLKMNKLICCTLSFNLTAGFGLMYRYRQPDYISCSTTRQPLLVQYRIGCKQNI